MDSLWLSNTLLPVAHRGRGVAARAVADRATAASVCCRAGASPSRPGRRSPRRSGTCGSAGPLVVLFLSSCRRRRPGLAAGRPQRDAGQRPRAAARGHADRRADRDAAPGERRAGGLARPRATWRDLVPRWAVAVIGVLGRVAVALVVLAFAAQPWAVPVSCRRGSPGRDDRPGRARTRPAGTRSAASRSASPWWVRSCSSPCAGPSVSDAAGRLRPAHPDRAGRRRPSGSAVARRRW